MGRIANKSNINTPDYWDSVYQAEISNDFWRVNYDRFSGVLKELNCTPETMFLDFAGGTGELADAVQKQFGAKCFVYERSRVATKYGRLRHPKLEFLDDVPTEKFDVVHCGQTLEHCDDPASLLKVLVNLAKQMLIVTVPYEDQVQDEEHVWEFGGAEFYDMLFSYGGHIVVKRIETDKRYLIGIIKL